MARKLIKQIEVQKRHNMIYQVDPDNAPAFICDCLSLENKTSIDELNCEKSFYRQKRDDISVNELLEIIYSCNFKFFSFILRKAYNKNPLGDNYWEFCASGMKNPVEYFLWIEIKEESGYKLVEKYKLIKNDEL